MFRKPNPFLYWDYLGEMCLTLWKENLNTDKTCGNFMVENYWNNWKKLNSVDFHVKICSFGFLRHAYFEQANSLRTNC